MAILNSILGTGDQMNTPDQPDDGSIMGGQTTASKAILDSTPHPLTNIPGSKSHEDGKMAYAQLIPKITADPGTSDYFRQRQEQLEFEKAHPYGSPISKHPGTFGTILHGLAKAGNIAGDIMAPGIMASIPGTDLNKYEEGKSNLAGLKGAQQTENQGKEASAAVTRAGAEQENADTAKRNSQEPKPKEEKWAITKDWVDADNSPLRMEENSGQLVRATDGKPPTGVKAAPTAKPEKPDTPEQQFIDDETSHGKTIEEAVGDYAKTTQKPPAPEKPQRQMGVTRDGKVIEITPGMTLPEGTQTIGGDLKADAGKQSAEDALNYAKDYLASNKYTGAGDEALMEKYFELAKPSSGFRMTQPQIEMLTKAQDIMNSLAARGKHLFSPEAPYFSPTLRQQIVDTMTRIEATKGQHGGGGGPQKFTDNGVSYNIPADKVAEFKKDHPNAR